MNNNLKITPFMEKIGFKKPKKNNLYKLCNNKSSGLNKFNSEKQSWDRAYFINVDRHKKRREHIQKELIGKAKTKGDN